MQNAKMLECSNVIFYNILIFWIVQSYSVVLVLSDCNITGNMREHFSHFCFDPDCICEQILQYCPVVFSSLTYLSSINTRVQHLFRN